MQTFADGGKTYQPTAWIETTTDCKEKAEVFVFVKEKFTITTANLVFFGVVKAIFNFVTGVCCDTFGRKWTLVIGWCCAIPMPLMVIFADNWWTVATSNIFLGMQQALVWSATIFIMIDYLGQENSGTAIGKFPDNSAVFSPVPWASVCRRRHGLCEHGHACTHM